MPPEQPEYEGYSIPTRVVPLSLLISIRDMIKYVGYDKRNTDTEIRHEKQLTEIINRKG